jgi:hypothetical protein
MRYTLTIAGIFAVLPPTMAEAHSAASATATASVASNPTGSTATAAAVSTTPTLVDTSGTASDAATFPFAALTKLLLGGPGPGDP